MPIPSPGNRAPTLTPEQVEPLEPREPRRAGHQADEGLPRPDIHKLAASVSSPRGFPALAVTGLFVLASFYTLYFCRSLLLPLVLAGLLSLLLSPVVRGLKRLHIPEPLGAGLVLLTVLGSVGFGIYQLSAPAVDWIQRAPQSLRPAEVQLRDIKRSVQKMGRANERAERMPDVSANPGQRPPAAAVAVHPNPAVREPQLSH